MQISGLSKGNCYVRIVREDELTAVMGKAEKIRVTEFSLEAV